MAAPLTKRFATLVADFSAAAQGASATVLDFSIGSVFRAFAEAQAGMATWLQRLYLFALSIARLSTSSGVWVDSWLADFGVTRLPPTSATGLVTFSRNTATTRVVVKVGTVVGTVDGSQAFSVYADPSNAAYSAADLGYVLPPGAATVDAPVQAQTSGTAGNVQANTIGLLKSAALGVDAVTNAAAFTSGVDQESDAAAKARFQLFIAGLSKGTTAAYAYALASVQNGLDYSILPNIDPAGAFVPGFTTIYVDDGSGAIPQNTLQAATDAAWAVRAAGIRIAVLPATRRGVIVQLTLTVAPGYDKPSVEAQVTAAITLAINGLRMSDTLIRAQLIKVAFAASSGVVNVANLTVNGIADDLKPLQGQTWITDSVQVS